MTTLIMNIGSLDARNASIEAIDQITKIKNVGSVIVSKENRIHFAKISMENIGSTLELDKETKLHTGPLTITKEMLESAIEPLNISLLGPLNFTPDITPELLDQKLAKLYVVGPIQVYEHISGVLMNKLTECVGPINTVNPNENRIKGDFMITNDWLNEMDDASDLVCSGQLELSSDLDLELYDAKISSITIKGSLKIWDDQKDLILKKTDNDFGVTKSTTKIGIKLPKNLGKYIFKENKQAKLVILKRNYQYLAAGTKLDAFTLKSIKKEVISSEGHIILNNDITKDLLEHKHAIFDTPFHVYFPESLSEAMLNHLTEETKGVPYNPEAFTVISGENTMTPARLKMLKKDTLLLVLGELQIPQEVSFEEICEKIGIVDNFGSIEAGADVCSILQDKVRFNEGSIEAVATNDDDDDDDEDLSQYDTVIKNMGNYQL